MLHTGEGGCVKILLNNQIHAGILDIRVEYVTRNLVTTSTNNNSARAENMKGWDNMESLIVSNKQYLSAQLNKATEQIKSFDMSVRNNQFGIAYVMGQVEEHKYYEQDGFDNAASWAMDAFGIKKSLAYQLITVGREYIREIRNNKGRLVGFASNIVESEPNTMPVIDYTANQLGRLATLGHDEVKRLHDEGTLSPRMTAKEIQDFLRATKAIKANSEHEEQSEQSEQPEQPEQPIVIGTRFAMFDDVNTSALIAELNARGFEVRRDGFVQRYVWASLE